MDRQQALRRYLVGLLAIGWARPMAFALAALGVAAAGGCEMSGGDAERNALGSAYRSLDSGAYGPAARTCAG